MSTLLRLLLHLTAFNYPNQDFAMQNSTKLADYIQEIKLSAKYGLGRKDRFFAGESDIYATKEDMENERARFILIGHSNGGLVSRYYIENLGGDNNVDKLITIDTPHKGSAVGVFCCSDGFVPLSELSTIVATATGSNSKCLPLDFELRPESRLFTGVESNIYSLILSYFATSRLYAVVMPIFKDDDLLYYMQHNQSEKLSRSTEVDTKYYAIAGARGMGEYLSFDPYCEFVPQYDSEHTFNKSINEAFSQKYSDQNLYFNIDVNFNDNVVELYSQLGVKFERGITDLDNIVAFEKMCLFVTTDNKYNYGPINLLGNMYHISILSNPNMHETVLKYIKE